MSNSEKEWDSTSPFINRREFIKSSMAVAAGTAIMPGQIFSKDQTDRLVIDDFDRPDTLYHGDGWQSLNPGYWKVENKALRRRLKNVGDGGRRIGFPWHFETHGFNGEMLGHWKNGYGLSNTVKYDPSLPYGMIWRWDWNLSGNYSIRIETTIKGLMEIPDGNFGVGNEDWDQYQSGYAIMGICFGGQSLFESWKNSEGNTGSWFAAWRDNGRFGVYTHHDDIDSSKIKEKKAPSFEEGDQVSIELTVTGSNDKTAEVHASLISENNTQHIRIPDVNRKKITAGYFGLISRGLLDFEVNRVLLKPEKNEVKELKINELQVCYPLGDTLKKVDDKWHCRFMAICRNDGESISIRISENENPGEGWRNVPVAGKGKIVNNEFRRNTAVVDVKLPVSPSEQTLYYTVWKDGRNVTIDPREGLLNIESYVGRLPKLQAPYRICGLSCHDLISYSDFPQDGRFEKNWVHTQPTPNSYKYLEEYDFQVMLWEDDVWYLERILYPPSTDDAYKIITTTIANTTTRWQMMRHWNVINPGDHEYGMDDVKGPEHFLIRTRENLGQDPEYMRRNFRIAEHLSRGIEHPDPWEVPKKWRRWKMPNNDFSLLVMDARSWRNSQDTNIWDDEGWGHANNLYSRDDATRTLLGEEQFGWLNEVVKTDTSPLICLTGINGLHPIWAGMISDPKSGKMYNQRDRVVADLAGWVKEGVERILDLLSSRDGMVSVYGDVHNGCLMKNKDNRVIECSFGPIGRSTGRSVKEDFGRLMQDYNDQELEVYALYHREYQNPELQKREAPFYWNFLEMEFNPVPSDPIIAMKIRNLIDSPENTPRGGGFIKQKSSTTGRRLTCKLPQIETLPDAEVHFTTTDGRPVRGARSTSKGEISIDGFVDIPPETRLIMTSFNEEKLETKFIKTQSL